MMAQKCGSANDIRDFASVSVGGYAHVSGVRRQQKKLMLTRLAAYDPQLADFLRDFALWLANSLRQLPAPWGLRHMSNSSLPLTLALLWPSGPKLTDRTVLDAAYRTIREVQPCNVSAVRQSANASSELAEADGASSVTALYRQALCHLRESGLSLRLVTRGMDCDKADALQFLSNVTCSSSPARPLVGMIAGTCSETVGPIAELSSHSRTVVVSPTVESAVYSDVDAYPYFFRTVPSLAAYSKTVAEYLRSENWPDVALLSSGKLFLRRDEFEKDGGLSVCFEEVVEEESLTLEHTKKILEAAKKKKCQVFAMDYLKRGTCLYLCSAYKLEMYQRENYLFILANRALDVFVNSRVVCHNTTALLEENPDGCTAEQIKNVANGHVVVQNHVKPRPELQFVGKSSRPPSKSDSFYYGVYTTQAVQLMAHALSRVLMLDPSAAYHLNSPRVATMYKEALENSSFDDLHLSRSHGIDRGLMMVLVRRFDMDLSPRAQDFFGTANTNDKAPISDKMKVRGKIVTSDFLAEFKWQQTGSRIEVRISDSHQKTKGSFDTVDGNFPKRFAIEDNCTTAFMRVFYRDLTCPQTIVALISSIFLLCLAGLLSIFVGLLRFYQSREEAKQTQPYQQLRDRLAEVEIPKQQVVLNRKMGKGCFGTVYGGEVNLLVSGVRSGWTSCAVKVMNDDLKQEAIMQFLEEAATLSQFRHDNIVQLLGVCTAEQPFYIVMEMCLHGDLKSFLMARRTQALTKTSPETCPAALTQYAIDIARGIDYLHNRHMVHRDLALRNCMINDRFQVKVGDFGLARYIKEYYRVQNNKLVPVRWMPPESIQYMYFTVNSDMWSYAVVLYEIVTFGKFPFQHLSQQQVISQVSRGLTLFTAFPADATPELRALVGRCWQFEPKDRPSVEEALEVLLNSPECVTPCLEEAPPQQPLEALRSSGDHLNLRGLGRHASVGRLVGRSRLHHQQPVMVHAGFSRPGQHSADNGHSSAELIL
uniref:Guanylate cyclase n=1 Tax=Macrostomum lignano TaxID=282301 RepID=A0A1I8HHF6_9PLAT